MNAKLVLSILGGPGTFVRAGLVRLLGGNGNAAILLSQYLYWQERAGLGEWFYNTAASLEEQTGLNANIQTRCRAKLVELGIIEQRLKRVGSGAPVVHVRVCIEVLAELLGRLEAARQPDSDFTETVKSISSFAGNPILENSEIGFHDNREMLINKDYQRLLKEREGEPEKPAIRPTPDTPPIASRGLPNSGDVWRASRQTADEIHSQLAPATRIALMELKTFDKRTDTQYWAWLREFVKPQIERLGAEFGAAAAIATRRAVSSRPGYCLADFAKCLEEFTPKPKKQSQQQYDYDAELDALIERVWNEGGSNA